MTKAKEPGERPYTNEEIVKQKCWRCGKKARFQWNACADNNVWRPLCTRCDVMVNILVLKFMDPENWLEKIKRYCYRIRFKWSPTKEEQNEEGSE